LLNKEFQLYFPCVFLPIDFCFMDKNIKERQSVINFEFSKKSLIRYISHLDMMRLLMRAARRAGMPLYFSKGFSPHPKLKIQRALKLGVESDCEKAQLVLTKRIIPTFFVYFMNRKLPVGLRINKAFYQN